MLKILPLSLLLLSFLSLAQQLDIKSIENLHAVKNTQSKSSDAFKFSNHFATIGFTNDCDFRASISSIQDVIDDPANYDEIRIATGTYTQGINITNKSINLQGGFASCADAEINESDEYAIAYIQPDSGPGIVILSGVERNIVNLSNLSFSYGNSLGLATSGGINTISADLELNLTNIAVSFNNGTRGGGISIQGGNTNVTAKRFLASHNTSDGGGGVYCSGHNASFTIDYNEHEYFGHNNSIYNNRSTDDGGGVLINEGCVFTSWVGTNI